VGFPKKNQKGGFSNFVNASANDRRPIRVQATPISGAPRCTAPFGVSKPYDPAQEDNNKRNFEQAIADDGLLAFLRELDEFAVREACRNLEAWFPTKGKKALTEDDIRGMYHPLVVEADEEKGYPPNFRTKVNIKGDKVVNVYVATDLPDGKVDCRAGSLSDIVPFVEDVPIFEIVGFWFMSKSFGWSLQTTDVVVFPKPGREAFDFDFGGGQRGTISSKTEMDENDVDPAEEARAAGARAPVGSSSSSKTLQGPAPPPDPNTTVGSQFASMDAENTSASA